jgi:hypothetical protein
VAHQWRDRLGGGLSYSAWLPRLISDRLRDGRCHCIGRKAEILKRTVLHSILFVPSIKLIDRVQDSLAEGRAEALSSHDACGATSRVDCPFVADNNRKEERTPSLICGAQGTCFKTRVIP